MARPARLTGALLARKGQAMPTGGFAHARLDLSPPQPPARADRPPPAAPAQEAPPEAGDPVAPAPRRRPARGVKDRVALTLRLDRERYMRLKVLATLRACAAQEILISALDAYLEGCATDHGRTSPPAPRDEG